jgi:hypothetical protein
MLSNVNRGANRVVRICRRFIADYHCDMTGRLQDYSPISPKTLRSRTREELLEIMGLDPRGVFGDWAQNELAARQMDELEKRIKELDASTNKVHQEVAILSSSSDRLEGLTRTLKNLTWALILLALLTAAVPILVEEWKARHESPRRYRQGVAAKPEYQPMWISTQNLRQR